MDKKWLVYYLQGNRVECVRSFDTEAEAEASAKERAKQFGSVYYVAMVVARTKAVTIPTFELERV